MGNIVEDYGATPSRQQRTESAGTADTGEAWSKQAVRNGNPAAWTGIDRCDRPAKGRAKCAYADRPHRHCACGLVINLDHGYCDTCFGDLLRGAAMTDYESQLQREKRLAWLLKYDFVEFDTNGIHVVRKNGLS